MNSDIVARNALQRRDYRRSARKVWIQTMQMPIRLPEVIMCGKPHARAKDFPLRNARPAVTWSVLRTLGFGFGTPRAISPTDRANAIAGLVLIAASVHSFQSPTRTRIRDTKELAWFTSALSALHSPSSLRRNLVVEFRSASLASLLLEI